MATSSPIQKNCHDCGVCTCMFADCLSLGCKIDFTSSDVTTHRKKLAWITLKDEIANMHKLPQRSPQARPPPDLCNPPSFPSGVTLFVDESVHNGPQY